MTAAFWKFPLRIAVLGTLTFFALLPQPWKGRLTLRGYPHDLVHLLAFGAAFLMLAVGRRRGPALYLTGLLLVAFGALLEWLQTRIYGNFFEYHDVVSDAAGVALGLLIRDMREA
ncbi:MAG TPA: hypothetical protein VMB03_12390 [Bryobacteraceae bacterium]|nr:hypothetical protein [Bryobacteraceae bacterium]